jgi:hypothetical protein
VMFCISAIILLAEIAFIIYLYHNDLIINIRYTP